MRSLRSRILFSASLVLITFLGFTSLLLDRAFRDSAIKGVEDRLRGRIFMLIGAADLDAAAAAAVTTALPDPALAIPGSGHYARIISNTNESPWTSRSLLGVELPAPQPVAPGKWRLERVESNVGEKLFSLSYAIIWEGTGERAPREFMVQACESEKLYMETVQRFRRSLWLWFAALSAALLIVQALNLTWGLRPLSSVGDEVRAIEEGAQDQVLGHYPAELTSLTSNLNKLLRHNREILKRYRNSLGDLAHSIKTPLAVLRNEIERFNSDQEIATAQEQIERIDRTVQYYLQRSASGERGLLRPPLAVVDVIERLTSSLRKVYEARKLAITIDVSEKIIVSIDEGDLMEIVGNLADNACKWARTTVSISAQMETGKDDTHGRLCLSVRDDGPGIPGHQLERIMQRGARLDESVEGHGIGLAIVREMVEEVYGGSLVLRSDASGTLARAELRLA